MIKDDFLENIITIFQQDERFEYVDFKIDIHQDTLKLVYIIEPKFTLTFQDKNHFKEKKNSEKYDIFGEAVPGKFSLHECFTLIKKDNVYLRIKEWLDDLWKEISYSSPLGLLEKEQEQIDEFCKKFDSAEGYFTTEEILKVNEELEKLKSELVEEIKHLVEDNETQKVEIIKLYTHFETLKQLAPYLHKKGWIRTLTGRIFHNIRRLLDMRQKAILKNQPQ